MDELRKPLIYCLIFIESSSGMLYVPFTVTCSRDVSFCITDCGDQIRTGATQEHDAECDMACVYGTPYETCGGANRLNIFRNDDSWY